MVERLQLFGMWVDAFNRAAELLTHVPVLPKPSAALRARALPALGWDWSGGRALTAAQGGPGSEDGAAGASEGCGMSLRNQRGVVGVFPDKHQDKMSHPGKRPVEGAGMGNCCWCRAWPAGLGRVAGAESAAPWLV